MASQDWSNGQYVITEIARTCLRTGDVVSGPYLWSKSSLSPEITTWNFDVHTYKIWSYPREGIFHLHPTCDRLYVTINGMCSVSALIYLANLNPKCNSFQMWLPVTLVFVALSPAVHVTIASPVFSRDDTPTVICCCFCGVDADGFKCQATYDGNVTVLMSLLTVI